MSWMDRLRPAAYTSPSGTRIEFTYENVGNIIKRRDKAFEFPDADGTYIQQLGVGGRRYPLRVFFWGADHDLQADQFDALLREPGIGILEHPMYGVVSVVPFGEFVRDDNLKTEANQSIFEVTFWETSGLEYPAPEADANAQIIAAVEGFQEAEATGFAADVPADTVPEKATLKTRYLAVLATAKDYLARAAAVETAVSRQFDLIVDSVNDGIDILVADPLTLAFQTGILLHAPARAAALIGDRLSAYGNLLNSISTGSPAPDAQSFYTQEMFAASAVSASALSCVNTTFESRPAALYAAETVLGRLQEFMVWRDAAMERLGLVDAGEAYQQLQQAVALVAGFLVEISFALAQERRITLQNDRTVLDLVAELYGEVDGKLDFFIRSNGLTGAEIIRVPKGREIVYYA